LQASPFVKPPSMFILMLTSACESSVSFIWFPMQYSGSGILHTSMWFLQVWHTHSILWIDLILLSSIYHIIFQYISKHSLEQLSLNKIWLQNVHT
jgi:hypothetical protein